MRQVPDFDIEIKPRDVRALMAKYEEKNTRIVTDVNVQEDDIVQLKDENYDQQKLRMKDKISQMDFTIERLRKNLTWQTRKHELLIAPKKAEEARIRREEREKQKELKN